MNSPLFLIHLNNAILNLVKLLLSFDLWNSVERSELAFDWLKTLNFIFRKIETIENLIVRRNKPETANEILTSDDHDVSIFIGEAINWPFYWASNGISVTWTSDKYDYYESTTPLSLSFLVMSSVAEIVVQKEVCTKCNTFRSSAKTEDTPFLYKILLGPHLIGKMYLFLFRPKHEPVYQCR